MATVITLSSRNIVKYKTYIVIMKDATYGCTSVIRTHRQCKCGVREEWAIEIRLGQLLVY